MGPMSGRAAGFCAGYMVPGYMNSLRRGRHGWRPGVYAPPSQELAALRSEVTFMEDAIKKTQERIAELEKKGTDQ